MALVFYNRRGGPVECALEITRALKTIRDCGLRMGIHSGPVSEVINVNETARISPALGLTWRNE